MAKEEQKTCDQEMPPLCQRFFADVQALIEEVKEISERLHRGDIRFVRVDHYSKKVNGLEARMKEAENWILRAKTGLSLGGTALKLLVGGNLIGTIILLFKVFS